MKSPLPCLALVLSEIDPAWTAWITRMKQVVDGCYARNLTVAANSH